MIRYKGYSISLEFRAIGKPDALVVKRLSASGNEATELCGEFKSAPDAMAWIDSERINVEVVPAEPEWSPYARRSA